MSEKKDKTNTILYQDIQFELDRLSNVIERLNCTVEDLRVINDMLIRNMNFLRDVHEYKENKKSWWSFW